MAYLSHGVNPTIWRVQYLYILTDTMILRLASVKTLTASDVDMGKLWLMQSFNSKTDIGRIVKKLIEIGHSALAEQGVERAQRRCVVGMTSSP